MKLKPTLFFILLFSQLLGRAAAGDPKLDSLNKALVLAQHDSDQIKLRCLIGQQAHIKRVGYWDSLLNQSRVASVPLGECLALAGLSDTYRSSRNYNEAVEYLRQSIDLAHEKNFRAQMPMLLKKLAAACHHLDVSNLGMCYKGIALAEEYGEKRIVVDFYSIIALYYFFLEDYTKALQLHQQCLKLSRAIDYTEGIVDALLDMGSDYYPHDRKKAAQYYLACRPYIDKISNKAYIANIYVSIGAAYAVLGQPDSSLIYVHKAMALKINDYVDISCLVVMAKNYLFQGKLAEAESTALQAVAICKKINFKVQLPDLAQVLKDIYLKQQNYKKALEAYELYVTYHDSVSNEKSRKLLLQKEFEQNIEKKKNENSLLMQQNHIQLLHTRYILVGLGSLLLLVLIIAYLLLRQNKLKADQQSIQLEQKLLRSQMNPHFIFNSLNSIQQLIISRKNDNAEAYLSKFSRLIRDLLESSTKENISVREEADMLLNYIEMEALRFSKSFSYAVMVDERLNADNCIIPHMMIQPFVENAIWHGLLAKDGERDLLVTFDMHTARTIRCVVDDNGVGREKSRQIESTFRKKSLALSFINQRLRLLSKTLKTECGVDIVDKKDSHGQTLGTRVIVILPIINK